MSFVIEILVVVFTFVLLLIAMLFFLIGKGINVFKKKNEHSHIRKILKLAEAEGGKLTLSQIVMNTNIPINDARKFMDQLMENELVELENDDDGTLYYVFYEILQRKKKLDEIRKHKDKEREYDKMVRDLKGDGKYLSCLVGDEDRPGIIDRIFIKVIDQIRKNINKW